MLADSVLVPECIYKPGSFTGLMTLYESSYLKLRQLNGTSLREFGDFVSTSTHDCDLHVEVLSREAYTTIARLTYWFEDIASDPSHHENERSQLNSATADPDLTIRIYHDASLVEAVSVAANHRHCKLRELAQSHALELDRRWKRNMLLNKWLDYLLDVGHSFT